MSTAATSMHRAGGAVLPGRSGAANRSSAPADASTDAPVEADQDRAVRVALVVVAALAVTVPLAVSRSAWASPGGAGDFNRRVSIAPFDAISAIALLWAVANHRLVRSLAGSRVVLASAGAYVAAFALSLAGHPSWLGVAFGLRLAAGLGVVAAVGLATSQQRARTLTLGVVVGVGVAQAALALTQATRRQAFGISPIDYPFPLLPVGSSVMVPGSLSHPYHLAVLLVVAQGAAILALRDAPRRWPWLAALALLGTAIAVTYTRSGLIGQVLLLAVLAVDRRRWRQLLPIAAAIALGLLVGAVGFGDGWVARGEVSVGANPSSDRGQRVDESLELLRGDPITGVGPGRYVTALAEEPRATYLPAHDVVLHEAAELGVLGGAATLALLALLVWRALRRGTWALALTVPMLPFLVLDAFPYTFSTGLALSAIWLGLVRRAMLPEATDPSTLPTTQAVPA
ncbi:O-antigen ligase family protein [Aquihabitans sp. G128]|uniref:O-antigen ligase family protein n=1 Tax=Aquihabitans sp. G128 TaxID=2849779 RepID=UPI001C21F976|nr:O-antigen ligase family protein [Aquihabitans sp. G128]QXC61698.1 O-antigen ligase family protein [Aquihabitans sp. G128]